MERRRRVAMRSREGGLRRRMWNIIQVVNFKLVKAVEDRLC